jgi:hypothetical protein
LVENFIDGDGLRSGCNVGEKKAETHFLFSSPRLHLYRKAGVQKGGVVQPAVRRVAQLTAAI